MPRNLLPCVVIFSLFLSFAQAAEKKNLAPHVHGEGTLNFVLDYGSNEAELNFKLPAIQVLGFEHKPKTAAEKKTQQEAHAKLKDPQSVFTLVTTSKADCVFGDSKLKIPYMDDHAHHGHDHGAHDHADYELSYKMKCKNLKAVEALQLTAFKNLKGLSKLRVEALVGDKALAQDVTAAKPELSLK